ncbi:MAG: DUF2283 domain-containing protein [Candidatus Omnitrophota bacterium]|jgi:uncharacterized protein YuzE|nr:MAG: DUF2283 domain-containing protein [Candidatus Omnitrophota bacterium]
MEALKILEQKTPLNWEFDQEADVLYLSIGEPRMAVGTDIGEGIVVCFDEVRNEIVGLTIIGFRERIIKSMKTNKSSILHG